jgi:hypothetical protein
MKIHAFATYDWDPGRDPRRPLSAQPMVVDALDPCGWNPGLDLGRSPCHPEEDDDDPLIVLTETKFNICYIPVWARYSTLRTFKLRTVSLTARPSARAPTATATGAPSTTQARAATTTRTSQACYPRWKWRPGAG